MKRVLYSIPLFFLLLPWLFFSVVVLLVGFQNPFALLLLLPTGALLGSAFLFHQNRTKREQHGVAAIGTSMLLMSPIIVLLIAFFSGGQSLAVEQAEQMGVLENVDSETLNAIGVYRCKCNFTEQEPVVTSVTF